MPSAVIHGGRPCILSKDSVGLHPIGSLLLTWLGLQFMVVLKTEYARGGRALANLTGSMQCPAPD
jgi:hypothetical protein